MESDQSKKRAALLLGGFIVSVIVCVLCALAAEAALRWFAPVPDPYQLEKNRKPVNQFIQSEFDPHFSMVIKPQPGLPGVSGEKKFSVDNMGFRGDDVAMPKPPGEYRVFIIGGSTTECLLLDDKEALNAVLETQLQAKVADNKAGTGLPGGSLKVKVYGAGKSGNASPDHVAMLGHRIVHLQPDLVIVFAGINDLTRSIYGYDYLHFAKIGADYGNPASGEDEESYWLRYALTEFQIPRRLYWLLKRVAPTDREVMESLGESPDYASKVALRKAGKIVDTAPKLNLTAYSENLRSLGGIARANGVEIIYMTQQTTWTSPEPQAADYQWMLYRNGVTYREDRMHEAMEELNEVTRGVARELGAGLYDLAKDLPKSMQYFYDDVHFNEAGSAETARRLAEFIARADLIHAPAHLSAID